MQWKTTYSISFCFVLSLLLLSTGCSSNTTIAGAAISSSRTATTPIPVVTDKGCPDAGKGQAATLPKAEKANTQTVVYRQQDLNSNITTIKSYDVSTKVTHDILNGDNNQALSPLSLSPDGQWLLFVASTKSNTMLQIMRLDGRYRQTVYCAPTEYTLVDALLSPDQHQIIFGQNDTNSSIKSVFVLDLTTGTVQTVLSTLQSGYPTLTQALTGMHSKQKLQTTLLSERIPLPGTPPPPSYIPLRWVNNNSVYLEGVITGKSGPLNPQWFLLHDIHLDASHQSTNVQSITPPDQPLCQNYDVTFNNKQLLCSTFTLMGQAGPAKIKRQSLNGGSQQTIYTSTGNGSLDFRVVSNSTLLFILNLEGKAQEVWKMNIDGSGLQQLMSGLQQNDRVEFGQSAALANTYQQQAITSHDGNFYAIVVSDITTGKSSLLYGQLRGEALTTFASTTNDTLSLAVIGWATI